MELRHALLRSEAEATGSKKLGYSQLNGESAMSKKPQPLGVDPRIMCALTPGTLGINDAASPDTPIWFVGDTPGTLGCQDHADPKFIGLAHLVHDHLRLHPPISPTPDLGNVAGAILTEYNGELRHGAHAAQFISNVTWAAQRAKLNPGFLAAVLLSEKDKPWYYICPVGTKLNDVDCINPHSCGRPDIPGVCSYTVGTDTYATEEARINAAVPAGAEVRYQHIAGSTHGNEHGNIVRNIHFDSGRDAVLGVAVYLKYGETMVRQKLPTFDAQPLAVQWGLTRMAMNPGIGKAESRIEKVRRGKNIFVHGKIERSPVKADSAMTRVVAIAFYLSKQFFGIEV